MRGDRLAFAPDNEPAKISAQLEQHAELHDSPLITSIKNSNHSMFSSHAYNLGSHAAMAFT